MILHLCPRINERGASSLLADPGSELSSVPWYIVHDSRDHMTLYSYCYPDPVVKQFIEYFFELVLLRDAALVLFPVGIHFRTMYGNAANPGT